MAAARGTFDPTLWRVAVTCHSPRRLSTFPRREVCLTAFMCSAEEEERRSLEARDSDLDRREALLEAREAALEERMRSAEEILAEADQRDLTADARDAAADQRETDLDRAEFLGAEGEYGQHWPERRAANLDQP